MGRFRRIDVLDLESQVFGQPEDVGAAGAERAPRPESAGTGETAQAPRPENGGIGETAQTLEPEGAGTAGAPWPEDIRADETDQPSEEGGPVCLELTLEDGSRLTCRVVGVFMEGEEEYIALEVGEDQIQVMGLSSQGEDGIGLRLLEDEEEQERALDAFFLLFTDAGEEPPPADDPSLEEGSEKQEDAKESRL